MERARWKAPAASRVDLVGVGVGSPVGRALASEESCLDCHAPPAMGKEPVLVISTELHQYTSDLLRKNNPLERSSESSVGIRVCERNCVPFLLPVVTTRCRCAMVRQSKRFQPGAQWSTQWRLLRDGTLSPPCLGWPAHAGPQRSPRWLRICCNHFGC